VRHEPLRHHRAELGGPLEDFERHTELRCREGRGGAFALGDHRLRDGVRIVGERAYVDVPFAEKDDAKRLGVRWDAQVRRWYAPPGRAPGLSRWAPAGPLPVVLPGEDRTFGSGLFVDLIPASCWFTNVRSCVSARDWDRLRTLVYGRAGNRCEVCAATVDRERQVWLEGVCPEFG